MYCHICKGSVTCYSGSCTLTSEISIMELCQVMMITAAESDPDTELLTQQTFCVSPQHSGGACVAVMCVVLAVYVCAFSTLIIENDARWRPAYHCEVVFVNICLLTLTGALRVRVICFSLCLQHIYSLRTTKTMLPFFLFCQRIYGLPGMPVFTTTTNTAVQHHSTTPNFMEEVSACNHPA